jgi:hypothetical protein
MQDPFWIMVVLFTAPCPLLTNNFSISIISAIIPPWYKAGLIVTGGIQGTSYLKHGGIIPPCLKLLKELGWSTLSERRRYFQATTMYKIVNGTSPIYLQNIILGTRLRNLQISLRNHLQVPRFRLSITEKSFRPVSGIRLWNSFPRPLRMCANISSFKTNFRNEYFPCLRKDFNYIYTSIE